MTFARITVDPERMGGAPCVRGLRFPVATVVAMVAHPMTTEETLDEHPDLEAAHIAECLWFAALAVQERELPLRQHGVTAKDSARQRGRLRSSG